MAQAERTKQQVRVRARVERILGIDPGTAATGFAIIDRVGSKLTPVWYDCLRTSADTAASGRLVSIHQACEQVIQRFTPDTAAVETLYFGASARAALAVGQARGVLMLACAQAGVDVFEYTPASIKQAVTGHGRADKAQMQQMVQVILRMSEPAKPDHAADALGIAICHAGSMTIA